MMKPGDLVEFKFTDKTRSLGIAGGPGCIMAVDGDKVIAMYTDVIFGPAGPYELSLSDVEAVPPSRRRLDVPQPQQMSMEEI